MGIRTPDRSLEETITQPLQRAIYQYQDLGVTYLNADIPKIVERAIGGLGVKERQRFYQMEDPRVVILPAACAEEVRNKLRTEQELTRHFHPTHVNDNNQGTSAIVKQIIASQETPRDRASIIDAKPTAHPSNALSRINPSQIANLEELFLLLDQSQSSGRVTRSLRGVGLGIGDEGLIAAHSDQQLGASLHFDQIAARVCIDAAGKVTLGAISLAPTMPVSNIRVLNKIDLNVRF